MSRRKDYTFTTSGVSPFITKALEVKRNATILGDLTVNGEIINGTEGE
jgi:hypothetical protein